MMSPLISGILRNWQKDTTHGPLDYGNLCRALTTQPLSASPGEAPSWWSLPDIQPPLLPLHSTSLSLMVSSSLVKLLFIL